MKTISNVRIPFHDRSGSTIAYLSIVACRDAMPDRPSPLIERDTLDSREHGETSIQLCESERYEYEIESTFQGDLRLRCSLATRRRSLKPGQRDAGLIETRSFCGSLFLELVEGEVSHDKPSLATALIDVRSVKLNYRTEYRGMLRRLSDEMCGIVVDARSSAKLGLCSSFARRDDAGWLQIQVELLREILDGEDFRAAINRIIQFPHERMSVRHEEVPSDRVSRWSPRLVQQMIGGNPRRNLPISHPVVAFGLASISSRIRVDSKSRNIDTAENRFVKFALTEFRQFLTFALEAFHSCRGWEVSEALTRRLVSQLDQVLSHGIFMDIGRLELVPIGSTVLQRKAGYRQIYRWWLRLKTASELSWDGGEDLFRAGQRDIASLYEYWLFFELLTWFCQKCRDGSRPQIEELLDGLEEGTPNLRLKKNIELGPFVGTVAGGSRRLNACFSYNRAFLATNERREGGSWTRRLHPDYTLTFWPEHLTEAEAEANEQIVHVHFDAKYRVENVEELFGGEVEGVDDDTNYKRQDLLKMHAYKDAIKRSQGAFVLYPGRNSQSAVFNGFHEILPGLGAFGVTPNEEGGAMGFDALEAFLDEMLLHISNQTTAQERASYHVAESYFAREPPVNYGTLKLRETDLVSLRHRAVPPAEHMVLVAWFENEQQKALAASEEGLYYVRLGRRRGSLHVHPNLSLVRNILLHTIGVQVAPGLLMLREPGFRIFTRMQLREEFEKAGADSIASWQKSSAKDDEEHIYALFKTTADANYVGQQWRGDIMMKLISAFESDARNKLLVNPGRLSAYPRVLPLREVLKMRA